MYHLNPRCNAREQVRLILGGEYTLFLYVSNGSAVAWSAYYNLGVNVFCSPDGDDVVRVTRVTFWRLFN